MNIHTSETQYLKTEVQRLSALVRAQQITIDKLEAQLEQEPVAWVGEISEEAELMLEKPKFQAVPLYTTPPQRTWVGLTPEQIQHRIDTHIGVPSPKYPLDNRDLINFALVIADELKGNNT